MKSLTQIDRALYRRKAVNLRLKIVGGLATGMLLAYGAILIVVSIAKEVLK